MSPGKEIAVTAGVAGLLAQLGLVRAAAAQPASADVPAPIAGGGILWLSIVVAAGLYLLLRHKNKRRRS